MNAMRRGARALLLATALLLGLTLGSAAHAQVPGTQPQLPTGPVSASIDLTRAGPPINPFYYGYFVENLRNWFETGLWAELLGDRKFFYPVNDDSVLSPPNYRAAFVGRWRPLGGTRVAMDSAHAWVGKHSPSMALEAGIPRGIQQAEISLTAGRSYTGRVVLATDPDAAVQVSLVWGARRQDRQTVAIPAAVSREYRTVPLSFTAGGTTRDGRLEISGTGSGTLRIGAVSLMPADNIEGFRADMIALLREVRPTFVRWGGNFSSNYEWRAGIGDRDRRAPLYDWDRNGVEPNDVGTFEFLALNRLLGSEPNIQVNSGWGDAWSAREWVEYVNGSVATPMGRLRAQHGRPEPFGVKWWGIGNEMYGGWQMGHMRIEHYVIKHNLIADAMREVDPSIILVASGASPFETSTTARHNRKPLPANRPYAYDSPEDWSGQLLRHSYQYFDYISEHIYAVPDQAFDANLQEFWPVSDPLHNRVRRVANRVRTGVEAWEEYQRRLPYLRDTDIRMVLDEWSSGAGGNTGEIGNALVVALVLNEMARRTDVWAMSAFTSLPGVLAYDRTDAPAVLRATGQVFKLYANQLGTIPVQVHGNSPQPELRGTVGVDKPGVSSGSPTFPLDVFAALSEDRRTLTVSVVNPTEAEQTLRLSFTGGTPGRGGKAWTVSTRDPGARSSPGQPPAATLTEGSVRDAAAPLTIGPTSIKLYEFQLQ